MNVVDTKLQMDSVNRFGDGIQSTICMEECAELIQAISKMKRGKDAYDNLVEEMADVYIILEQLQYIYSVADVEIQRWIKKKQDRQRRLLED